VLKRELNILPVKFSEMQNIHFCKECGKAMTEVERHRENGALFVWYQCTQDDCNGQWLQKIPNYVLNGF